MRSNQTIFLITQDYGLNPNVCVRGSRTREHRHRVTAIEGIQSVVPVLLRLPVRMYAQSTTMYR